MATVPPASGLVLVIGEGLWWDLEAIAHWGADLERIVLVGPAGAGSPGRAGDRLTRFIVAHVPHAKVEPIWLDDVSTGPVRVAIEQRIRSTSGAWLVSGAGGTRTMSIAAYLASTRTSQAVFVVRDQMAGWRRIDDGEETELLGLDPRAMEAYSAADLLAVTWADENFEVQVRSTNVEPEITEAARRSVAGAPWLAEFEAATSRLRGRPGGSQVQRGFLFERFVLAITRALGVCADDVLVGSLLTHAHQRVQEVDVVVNSGGRLHVIDCKLTATGATVPPAAQVRDSDATGHYLADGAEQYIMLRPNWVADEAVKALADRFGIRVVDRVALARQNLPDALADLLLTGRDRCTDKTGKPA